MSIVTVGGLQYHLENEVYTPLVKESGFEKRGGTYRLENELLYPRVELGEESKPRMVGKYGGLRRTFLLEERRPVYMMMFLEGTLEDHLEEVNEQAMQRMDLMMGQMMEKQGVTEELKAQDQMRWVQKVNGIKRTCEEVIYAELIYV